MRYKVFGRQTGSGSRNWSSGPAHSARGGRGEAQATEDRAHRSLLGAYARQRHSFGGEIALVANVVTAVLVNFAMTSRKQTHG